MMTREQIERIAANCGVVVSYVETGKGGFIVDSTNIKVVFDSVMSNLVKRLPAKERNPSRTVCRFKSCLRRFIVLIEIVNI